MNNMHELCRTSSRSHCSKLDTNRQDYDVLYVVLYNCKQGLECLICYRAKVQTAGGKKASTPWNQKGGRKHYSPPPKKTPKIHSANHQNNLLDPMGGGIHTPVAPAAWLDLFYQFASQNSNRDLHPKSPTNMYSSKKANGSICIYSTSSWILLSWVAPSGGQGGMP